MEDLGSTLGGAASGSHGLGVFEALGDEQPARIPQGPAGGGPRAPKPGKSRKGGGGEADEDAVYTTIMLRNIPNKYTRQMLIDQLHSSGFRGDIDYLYLPIDFANRCNVGYCFCNFRTAVARQRFVASFDGVAAQSCLPGFNSYKVCQVTKARWQGREENVRRLRSSPELMAQLAQHPEWLPLLMTESGEQEIFLCDDGDLPPPRPGAKRQARTKNFRPTPGAMPDGTQMYPGGAQGGVGGWPGMPGAPGGFRAGGGRGGQRGGFGGLDADMAAYMDHPAGSYAMPMMSGMPMMAEQGVQYMPYGGGFGGADYFMPYAAGGGGYADYSTMGYGSSGWWGSPGRGGGGMEAFQGAGGRPGRGAGRGGKRRVGGGCGACAGGMEGYGVGEASYSVGEDGI